MAFYMAYRKSETGFQRYYKYSNSSYFLHWVHWDTKVITPSRSSMFQHVMFPKGAHVISPCWTKSTLKWFEVQMSENVLSEVIFHVCLAIASVEQTAPSSFSTLHFVRYQIFMDSQPSSVMFSIVYLTNII